MVRLNQSGSVLCRSEITSEESYYHDKFSVRSKISKTELTIQGEDEIGSDASNITDHRQWIYEL